MDMCSRNPIMSETRNFYHVFLHEDLLVLTDHIWFNEVVLANFQSMWLIKIRLQAFFCGIFFDISDQYPKSVVSSEGCSAEFCLT